MNITNLLNNLYKHFEKIVTVALYVGFIAIMIVCIHEKTNLHCDEVYTHVLANNTMSDSISVAPDYNYIYENPEQAWLDKMTVQRGEQFNFSNVWYKQAQDTHPPLYYSLVHIICSLFPNVYSKWFAGIVNITFGLLTLHTLRSIVRKLSDSPIAVFLTSSCFIFSAGVLSALTFFRMYVVTMFFVTLVSYIFLKGTEQRDIKFYIALFLTSVAGALTHYYFIIYLFYICLVFGIWLLLKKQWKHIVMFIATMTLAGGTAVLTFPAMISHMFGGSLRGSQTMEQLTDSSLTYLIYKINSTYTIVNSQLFGGLFAVLIISIITFYMIWILFKKWKDLQTHTSNVIIKVQNPLIKWLLLWIPVVAYFITISHVTVYLTDRYFHPIYGLLILLVVTSLCVTLEKVIPVKWAFAILIATLLFTTFRQFGDNWFYLYRGTQSFLNTAATHSDKDCIQVFSYSYEIDPAFYEISNYDRVVFVPYQDVNNIGDLELNTDNGLILSICTSCDPEPIKDIIQQTWPHLKTYEEIGRHSFSVTYYFHQ